MYVYSSNQFILFDGYAVSREMMIVPLLWVGCLVHFQPESSIKTRCGFLQQSINLVGSTISDFIDTDGSNFSGLFVYARWCHSFQRMLMNVTLVYTAKSLYSSDG